MSARTRGEMTIASRRMRAWRHYIALLIAVAACLVTPALAYAVPGDVDTTFQGGTGRFQVTDHGENEAQMYLGYEDGSVFAPYHDTVDNEFKVAKVAGSGTGLQSSYGTAGTATFCPSGGVTNWDSPQVAVANDTSLIIALQTDLGGGNYQLKLCKLFNDGSVDATFDANALATGPIGADPNALAPSDVAIDPANGRIYVLSSVSGGVRAFNADGTFDTTYGTAGLANVDDGALLSQRAVSIAGTTFNSVVVAGDYDNGIGGRGGWATMLAANGTRSASFNGGANVLFDTAFTREVVIDPNPGISETIYVAGSTFGTPTDGPSVTRLTNTGAVDGSYGVGGTALVHFTDEDPGQLHDIALANGNIVVAGEADHSNPSDFDRRTATARLTFNGVPDSGYGHGGDPIFNSDATVSTTSTGAVLSGCDVTVPFFGFQMNTSIWHDNGGIGETYQCTDGSIDTYVFAQRLVSENSISGVSATLRSDTQTASGHEVMRPENFPGAALSNSPIDTQTLAYRSGAYRSGAYRSGAYRSGAYRSGAYRSGAYRSGAYRSGAYRSGAYRSGAYRSGAYRSGNIARAITLADLPLSDPTGTIPELSWRYVLQGTQYEDVPLHLITLQDVFDLRDSIGDPVPAALQHFVTAFDGLHPDDADISATPLRRLSVASNLLGDVPLSKLTPPTGYDSWCDYLEQDVNGNPQPYRCGGAVNEDNTTLADLEFFGDEITSGLVHKIELTPDVMHGQLGGRPYDAFVGGFALKVVDLSKTALADVPVANVPTLLAHCGDATHENVCETPGLTLGQLWKRGDLDPANPQSLDLDYYFGDITISDLVDRVAAGGIQTGQPGPDGVISHIYLSDLIPGLIVPEAYNIEDLSTAGLSTLLDTADVRPHQGVPANIDTQDNVEMRFDFTLDCNQVNSAVITATVPDGFRYDHASIYNTGGSGSDVPMPAPTRAGNVYTFSSFPSGNDGICAGAGLTNYSMFVVFEPGYRLGDQPTIPFNITTDDGATVTRSVPSVTIDDSHDQDNNSPQEIGSIEPETVYAHHISSATDLDFKSIHVPADAPIGMRINFSLSHLPADYDLVILGPGDGIPTLAYRSGAYRSGAYRSGAYRSGAYRSGAYRSGAYRSGGLPDDTQDTGGDVSDSQPNTLQDVPIPARDGMVVRNSSIHRNLNNEFASVVVNAGDRGKNFIVEVAGFNGAHSDDPYILRATESAPPTPLPCVASRTGLNTGPAMSFDPTTVPAGTQTLFLVNDQRIGQLYSQADRQNVLDRLSAVAAMSNGVVVPVESDPDAAPDASGDIPAEPTVTQAYDAWDANPCDVAAAAKVTSAINAVVDDVRHNAAGGAGLSDLRNVVIVGGDDLIPQGRTPDQTATDNESTHADEIAFNGHDTPISRALREGNTLSDDSYGSFHPRLAFGTQMYVPEVALGRLVETPAQIVGQLQQYVDSNGTLNPQTATVLGYDFFSDSSTAEADALGTLLGNQNVTRRIANAAGADAWNAADGLASINSTTPQILAPNAHYTETVAYPASYNYGSTAPGGQDLITTTGAHPTSGDIVFTMGCHAGLNLSNMTTLDTADGESPSDLLDWAEVYGNGNDIYVASTGYGLGDDASNAYTERLLTYFSQNLGPGMTAGQALLFAKQRYLSEGIIGGATPAFDAKGLQQTTFYGLPMYKVGTAGTSAPSVVQPDSPEPPAEGDPAPAAPPVTTSNFDSGAIDNVEHNTPDGTFYQASTAPGTENLALATENRPLQPQTTVDTTTPDGTPTHGALLTDVTSNDVEDVDPVIDVAQPTGGPVKTEPKLTTVFFPSNIQNVTDRLQPDGKRHDIVTLATGQFFNENSADGKGTQRLFTRLKGKALHSTSADYDAPDITSVDATSAGDTVTFTVQTKANDATKLAILYRVPSDPHWYYFEFTRPVGTQAFIGQATLPPGAIDVSDYIVQLVDTSGNVGKSTNKGPGYKAHTRAEQPEGAPTLTATSATEFNGIHTSDVTVTLDKGNDEDQQFYYRYTNEAGTSDVFEFNGPVTVHDDGAYFFEAGGDSPESYVTIDFTIDQTKPTISGALSTPLGEDGWTNADPVQATYTCADNYSGIATCGDGTVSPDTVSVTPAPGPGTISGVAADNAGNTSDPLTFAFKSDKDDPTISAAVLNGSNAVVTPNGAGWYRGAGLHVHYTCADALSGLRTADGCPADAPLSDTAGSTFAGTAHDKAGNSKTASITVKADNAAPTITATVRDSADAVVTANAAGWYRGAGLHVHFTCADALSGVAGGCPADVALGDTAGQTVSGSVSDVAGNSASASITVKVDTSAPTISAQVVNSSGTPVAPGEDGWYRGPGLKVHFTCADIGPSDLATGGCTADVALPNDTAGTMVIGIATDKAGNTASTNLTVKVDSTPPTLTVTVLTASNVVVNPGSGGGYAGTNLHAHFTCADNLSGVSTTCPADVPLANSSGTTVSGTIFDKAGNSKTTTLVINVSSVPPTIVATVRNSAGATVTPTAGWYRGPGLKVHFTCADVGGPGLGTPCPADVALSDNTAGQTVSGTVSDTNGVSATTSAVYQVDSTVPTSVITDPTLNIPLVAPIKIGIGQTTFTGQATDNLSGIASVTVKFTPYLGLGATYTYTATLTCNTPRTSCTWTSPSPPTLGVYRAVATAVDVAGNTKDSLTAQITVIL